MAANFARKKVKGNINITIVFIYFAIYKFEKSIREKEWEKREEKLAIRLKWVLCK